MVIVKPETFYIYPSLKGDLKLHESTATINDDEFIYADFNGKLLFQEFCFKFSKYKIAFQVYLEF